jgi:hypothetical protein
MRPSVSFVSLLIAAALKMGSSAGERVRKSCFSNVRRHPRYRGTIYIINDLLKTQPGPKSVELLLDPLRSLVSLDDNDIYPLHKSLFDYLLDPARSGPFPCGSSSHATILLANYIFRNWGLLGQIPCSMQIRHSLLVSIG